jgi:hypothetical protein
VEDVEFVDESWSNAPSPFFYGDTGYTNAPKQGTYLWICRVVIPAFIKEVVCSPNINAVTSLFMNAQCDDGFVAYINGVEVLRYNVSGWRYTV